MVHERAGRATGSGSACAAMIRKSHARPKVERVSTVTAPRVNWCRASSASNSAGAVGVTSPSVRVAQRTPNRAMVRISPSGDQLS
ncbi:MAG: hypothetical protein IPM11_08170 [Micropruina sp.]|nr:hypothetical protein [Micropruina sp.]